MNRLPQVENLTSPRTGNPVANQFRIITDKGCFFQSYNSLICAKVDGKIYLGEDWDYSNTTLKYLKEFLRDWSSKAEIQKKLDSGEYLHMEDLK